MQEKRKVVRRKGELEAVDLAAELVAMDSVEARAKVGVMLARKVLGAAGRYGGRRCPGLRDPKGSLELQEKIVARR